MTKWIPAAGPLLLVLATSDAARAQLPLGLDPSEAACAAPATPVGDGASLGEGRSLTAAILGAPLPPSGREPAPHSDAHARSHAPAHAAPGAPQEAHRIR